MIRVGDEYLDISSHNGTPDLHKYAKDGHTHLVLKVTEGTVYHWEAMQGYARLWHSLGAEYTVGYYHWLYGTESGTGQFDYFWSFVTGVWRPGDEIMVDFEDVDPRRWVTDATHRRVAMEFAVAAARHGYVYFYAPNWYIANMPLCREFLKSYDIAESDYSHDPALNPYGMNITRHQFTDRKIVPGFAGPVDCNRVIRLSKQTLPIPSPSSPAGKVLGDDMSQYMIFENEQNAIGYFANGRYLALNYGAVENRLDAASISILCNLPLCANTATDPNNSKLRVPQKVSTARYEMMARVICGYPSKS
jgi:hypothetical protein